MILEAGFALALVGASVLLLSRGADWTIDSSISIARRLNWSEEVVGATLVALGTSAPEMVVSLAAALGGQPDISVGNVVGSNIFNLGLIFGLVALVWGMPVSRSVARRDMSVLLGASVVLLAAIHDLELSRLEGLGMTLVLGFYLVYLVRSGESPVNPELDSQEHPPASARHFVLFGVGLASIIVGAQMLVGGATRLAEMAGVPEWAIATTVVAGGTSLPELVTAVAAARRGFTGVMAGMLIGSDIFNILGVLGVAAAIEPLSVAQAAGTGVALMVGSNLILLALLLARPRLGRAIGAYLIVQALARWAIDLSS